MSKDTPSQIAALREHAARLLITPSALEELSLQDALEVVDYMDPLSIRAGAVIMREGEAVDNDHMLLVVDGELSVEKNALQPGNERLVVRLMGPGGLIGELGLLDGSPRSASCVATTDMLVAVLTRASFLRLLQERPRVGARLLLAISKRMADHLRETTRKLELFAKMNRALSDELMQLARERHTESD